jgi:glutamate formiminotransferase
MGYKVNCLFSGDIAALVYLVETRSSKMVHPTLRVKAIELGKMLRKELQIPIYLDEDDLEGLDTKRGTNDIVEK